MTMEKIIESTMCVGEGLKIVEVILSDGSKVYNLEINARLGMKDLNQAYDFYNKLKEYL
jgi:hypothetical protein